MNCIFGHHAAAESRSLHHNHPAAHSPHHADAATHQHAGKGRDRSASDTCCKRTGKFAVSLTAAPAARDLVAVAATLATGMLALPAPRVSHLRHCAPLAHSPPAYLRNAALLI